MMSMVKQSPFARYAALPFFACKWEGGFWTNRLDACRMRLAPNIYRIFDDDTLCHFFANFHIASGDRDGGHEGPSFSDGECYKWLEGASYLYGLKHDAKMKQQIDTVVSLISRVQRDDGLVSTLRSIEERKRGKSADIPLDNNMNFEVYNMGHLLSAAATHFRATGERTLLDVGYKAGDYLASRFNESARGTVKTAICPSHYLGLLDLYHAEGRVKYLETARMAIELRDSIAQSGAGSDDNQDRVPFREQREMLGHAVRAVYLYAGATAVYAETGDATLLSALDAVWNDMTEHKMYINSGIGALYDGVSPSGYAGDHPALQRTHQSFGHAYQLPNITAYNETCASVGNILWNWERFLVTGDCACIDIIESSFYNMVFASLSIDCVSYFYTNVLRRENEQLPYFLKWPRRRSPYLSSFCCPPNVLRVLAKSSLFSYAVDKETLSIGIYGNSVTHIELENGAIFTLRQTTNYPWDGDVVLSFDTANNKECAINIRIPGWLESGTIGDSYNTKRTLTKKDASTFVSLKRAWKSGDIITLHFAMDAVLFTAHPLIESDNNHIAVMRGPVLYCAESYDNDDTHWNTLGIAADATFQTAMREIDGFPFATLETDKGIWYDERGDEDCGYARTAYKPLCKAQTHLTRLRLIPYFLWDNRDDGAMKVWLPAYWTAARL